MARTVRERGRPRADWDEDAAIVRQWRDWAHLDGWKVRSMRIGRVAMREFHDFKLSRIPDGMKRDYYRPEHGVDFVVPADAEAFREKLVAEIRTGRKSSNTNAPKWIVVKMFFAWRAQHQKSKRNTDELAAVKLFWDLPKFDDTSIPHQPFATEHVPKVLEAAQSTSTDEDYAFALLLTCTAGRAQFYGLKREQVRFDTGLIGTYAKMGEYWELRMPPQLVEVLRALDAKYPGRRMLFRNGAYPYTDKIAGVGRCEYKTRKGRCESRHNLAVYYGRERDEVYCEAHMDRTLDWASTCNNGNVELVMHRIEERLHALYPDLTEEYRDRKTGATKVRPVHVTSHRFRKTAASYCVEVLKMTPEEVAKIFGWKSEKVVRELYALMSKGRKAELADKFANGVTMGTGASAGVKSETDVLREENAALRAQVAGLTTQIGALSGQFAEFMARLPKNGGTA